MILAEWKDLKENLQDAELPRKLKTKISFTDENKCFILIDLIQALGSFLVAEMDDQVNSALEMINERISWIEVRTFCVMVLSLISPFGRIAKWEDKPNRKKLIILIMIVVHTCKFFNLKSFVTNP